jgi:hypothetical protein
MKIELVKLSPAGIPNKVKAELRIIDDTPEKLPPSGAIVTVFIFADEKDFNELELDAKKECISFLSRCIDNLEGKLFHHL